MEGEPATFGAFPAEFVTSAWTDGHCGADGLAHQALSSLIAGQSTCDTLFYEQYGYIDDSKTFFVPCLYSLGDFFKIIFLFCICALDSIQLNMKNMSKVLGATLSGSDE